MSGKREHPKEGRKNWIIYRMIMFSGIGYIVVHEKNGYDHEIQRMQKTGCSPIHMNYLHINSLFIRWWKFMLIFVVYDFL